MSYCYRHPERPARRRCFQCKRPICPTCQHRLDHHIFCSHRCHLAWRRAERRRRWRRRFQRLALWLDPRIWWRYPAFQRVAWARRTTLLLWLLLGTQLLTAAALWSLVRSSETGGTADRRPAHWLAAPSLDPLGVVHARIAGGETGAWLTQDGRTIAWIPAGAEVAVTLPPPGAATVLRLLPPGLPAEHWLTPSPPPLDVRRITGTTGLAITFDGGAGAEYAERILRTLRRHRVRATFFLTGRFIDTHPELVRRIAWSGHEVGNHTWSHPHLTTYARTGRFATDPRWTRERFQWELLRTEHRFLEVTGRPMAPYWRAPYGEVNAELRRWAAELGYLHVGWTAGRDHDHSLDTLDWVSDPQDPLYRPGATVAARLLALARRPEYRGGIVLMHLGGHRRPDPVQDHLDSLLNALRRAGIPIAPVGTLLASRHTP